VVQSNRATNEFECRSALIATGAPYQDIGALQAEYISVTGDRDIGRDSPGFAALSDGKSIAKSLRHQAAKSTSSPQRANHLLFHK